MTSVILRRRKLGRTSTKEIANKMLSPTIVIRNWRESDLRIVPSDVQYVFRWGCTSTLEGNLSDATVVNTADSIHWCNDKRQSRLVMQEAGVPVPATYTAPNQISNDDCDSGIVIRPVRHAQGRNLDVTYGYNSLITKLHELNYGEGNYYLSALIEKVAEYRVFVCSNRAVWVAKKTPGNSNQVAWNVAQGGRFDNVRWGDWPIKVVDAALKAAKVSGTDFCGVDVMVDAEDNVYVLEVNSAPSQTSPYRQSCVAKAFSYIVENGKTPFPDVIYNPRRTYKSYIHPAVRG